MTKCTEIAGIFVSRTRNYPNSLSHINWLRNPNEISFGVGVIFCDTFVRGNER